MPSPGKRVDLTGQRFGRLVVLGFDHRTSARRSMWRCRCDCGTEVIADGGNLRTSNTASCGCFRRDVSSATSTTHGHGGETRSPEYESWCAMLARVRATSGLRFRDYGARGITACERWKSFENFLADMGPRPEGTTLDRVNNDGNYEPGNCR